MQPSHARTDASGGPGSKRLPPQRTIAIFIASVWNRPLVGLTCAGALAAAVGVLGAWLVPRGPVTTTEALITMAVGLAVGVAGGMLTGSRWSLFIAPVAIVAAFELARIGVTGPTVDGVHVDGMLGIIAFVVGRVFPAILMLVPMLVGGVVGIWIAGQAGHTRAFEPGVPMWAAAVLASFGMVALAIAIAQPARTAPIVGADGQPLAESVAELTTVEIGGHDQVLMIRGRSVENPVLLYLTGGPGGTDLGAIRQDVGLEQDFTVVVWEQRGAGKSYAALDPIETFTLDRLVADTIEVTEYLRERFDQDRIYLVGQSWGSTLGVLAAQARPDLYHAYVGVGQMVSQRLTDVMFWEDTLAWARETGNAGLERTLVQNGPPPYTEVHLYDPVVSHEHAWNPYPEFDPSNEMPAILFVPEYTFMDRVNAFRGFLDTSGKLYPQLQGIDFRVDVPRLDVPVTMVLGNREARGRAVLANEWFDGLDAPTKRSVVIEGGGHRAHFDRPARFAEIMREVLGDTR